MERYQNLFVYGNKSDVEFSASFCVCVKLPNGTAYRKLH